MLTVDNRCTMTQCREAKGVYRMVGKCVNCGQDDILILNTVEHEARRVQCPVCGCRDVMQLRRATDDEIPAS